MSNEDELPEELIELERSLATLAPCPSRIDRDRLMYECGAASTHCRELATGNASDESKTGPRPVSGRFWQFSTAIAATLLCVFASLYAIERNRPPITVHEVVAIEGPAPTMASERVVVKAPTDHDRTTQHSAPKTQFVTWIPHTSAFNPQFSNYLALRQRVLTEGIDALPRPDYVSDSGLRAPPVSVRDLMKELLPGSPLDSTHANLGDTI